MIAYQNFIIYLSVLFYIASVFACRVYNVFVQPRPMFTKGDTILNIDEVDGKRHTKWVPKKKHDILKTKYKCLKKLFQIYDATLMDNIPESYREQDVRSDHDKIENTPTTCSKADASAGTHCLKLDASEQTNCEELNECDHTLLDKSIEKSTETEESRAVEDPSAINIISRSKSTRSNSGHLYKRRSIFQSFLRRLLGLKRMRYMRGMAYVFSANGDVWDNGRGRKRRGIRIRKERFFRARSDSWIHVKNKPAFLNYVQSVQKSFLMDTTARQCPIVGCQMMFYGIINYNDHLNLCHFQDKKFACHYCHEGFEGEHDKFAHENEHIGLTRLQAIKSVQSLTSKFHRNPSNTQSEPAKTNDLTEVKLKKIISFFVNIVEERERRAVMQKISDVNTNKASVESVSGDSTDNRSVTRTDCKVTSVKSRTNREATQKESTGRGKVFVCRDRLHSDSVDAPTKLYKSKLGGTSNKSSKRESDTGPRLRRIDTISTLTDDTNTDFDRSLESLSYDPLTNIVYYHTSMDSLKNKLKESDEKMKNRLAFNCKWESGTNIIHV